MVDVVKPEFLLVPSLKSLAAPPTPPTPIPFGVDHFLCYKIAHARFREAGITVDDQFASLTVDIKKPIRLCAPVDKNGEGIQTPDLHMLCYQVRTTSGTPKFTGIPDAFVNNQFGPDTLQIRGIRELCVPSTKMLP